MKIRASRRLVGVEQHRPGIWYARVEVELENDERETHHLKIFSKVIPPPGRVNQVIADHIRGHNDAMDAPRPTDVANITAPGFPALSVPRSLLGRIWEVIKNFVSGWLS